MKRLVDEELLEQVLFQLEAPRQQSSWCHRAIEDTRAATSLRTALGQSAPVQEPVAWRLKDEDASEHYGKDIYVYYDASDIHMDHPDASKLTALLDPLYTAPQARQPACAAADG